MMNLILENSKYVDYYTYLDEVFSEIPTLQEYEWYVSDLEYVGTGIQNESWISGKALYEIVTKEKIQFIWGVFSVCKERVEVKEIPVADMNNSLWKANLMTQIPEAKLEIICWDSSLTLFINCDDTIVKALKKLYPDIKELS